MVLPKVLAQTVPLQEAAIDIFRNKHEARRRGTVAALQRAGVPGCTQVAGVCVGGGVDSADQTVGSQLVSASRGLGHIAYFLCASVSLFVK